MPLPTINAVNPVKIASQPALEFNEAFLTMLNFQALIPTEKWNLKLATRAFNAATGQLGPEASTNTTEIRDVAAYAAKYPVFAQTLGAVLVVAGLVQNLEAAELAFMDVTSMPLGDDTRDAKLHAAEIALALAKTALGA